MPVWYIKCFWIVLWVLHILCPWLWLKVLSQWLLCALSAWDVLLIFITIPVFFFIFYVFANGVVRSPSTFLYLWGYDGMGVAASQDCGSIFIEGLEVDVGGIGQSFLNSNRFPNIDPALGHEVPAWVGIFSSGGELLLDELPWEGLPFSKYIVVLGATMNICVIILLALGVDSGLATTHTLYLFVGMSFLLLSVAFAFLLTRGLVLGWVGLD